MDIGLDPDVLEMTLAAIQEFADRNLPVDLQLRLDRDDECPEDLVRKMCGDDLGIQLLFIPEEYGGMGGGTFDVYRVCERMAAIDVGVATSVLATFLGSDPIAVGATAEQKKEWLTRIATEGMLFAYGATEPEAGSDLGALKTTADSGRGGRQRRRATGSTAASNGSATAASPTPTASWPRPPAGRPGSCRARRQRLHTGQPGGQARDPAEQHRCALPRRRPVDRGTLVGGVEGQGLLQAQQVFGYTRLMVAAFGLGAGWSALDRAITYSTERIQAGSPLSEKQGYTHKLIVPHVARLEAARAYIEETAERIDAGEGSLNTEGAIAKYLATEAGNAAAEAAIQAHGGYGYTREYLVEKIKRDVRITTIYEGTSEIMEMTIARDRWQEHLKTRGRYYHDRAEALEALDDPHPGLGAGTAALSLHALAEVLEWLPDRTADP